MTRAVAGYLGTMTAARAARLVEVRRGPGGRALEAPPVRALFAAALEARRAELGSARGARAVQLEDDIAVLAAAAARAEGRASRIGGFASCGPVMPTDADAGEVEEMERCDDE